MTRNICPGLFHGRLHDRVARVEPSDIKTMSTGFLAQYAEGSRPFRESGYLLVRHDSFLVINLKEFNLTIRHIIHHLDRNVCVVRLREEVRDPLLLPLLLRDVLPLRDVQLPLIPA